MRSLLFLFLTNDHQSENAYAAVQGCNAVLEQQNFQEELSNSDI